jgi:hypothetical protein
MLTRISIVSSDMFTFLVGHNRKPFKLHKALVAHQSLSLNVLVNGNLKEAKEQCAIWDEVAEDTFVRFSQFAYTGDYEAPVPMSHKQSLQTLHPGSSRDSTRSTSNSTGRKLGRKESSSWRRFRDLYSGPRDEWYLSENSSDTYTHDSSAATAVAEDTHVDTLLFHVKMYVFSDYHDIQPLLDLSLRKLHQGLISMSPDADSLEDTVRLLRYAFENTVDRDGHADQLRSLLTLYAACKARMLWRCPSFEQLVRENGDFMTAFISKLIKQSA